VIRHIQIAIRPKILAAAAMGSLYSGFNSLDLQNHEAQQSAEEGN
jgi:hypothetical protein